MLIVQVGLQYHCIYWLNIYISQITVFLVHDFYDSPSQI